MSYFFLLIKRLPASVAPPIIKRTELIGSGAIEPPIVLLLPGRAIKSRVLSLPELVNPRLLASLLSRAALLPPVAKKSPHTGASSVSNEYVAVCARPSNLIPNIGFGKVRPFDIVQLSGPCTVPELPLIIIFEMSLDVVVLDNSKIILDIGNPSKSSYSYDQRPEVSLNETNQLMVKLPFQLSSMPPETLLLPESYSTGSTSVPHAPA